MRLSVLIQLARRPQAQPVQHSLVCRPIYLWACRSARVCACDCALSTACSVLHACTTTVVEGGGLSMTLVKVQGATLIYLLGCQISLPRGFLVPNFPQFFWNFNKNNWVPKNLQ